MKRQMKNSYKFIPVEISFEVSSLAVQTVLFRLVFTVFRECVIGSLNRMMNSKYIQSLNDSIALEKS